MKAVLVRSALLSGVLALSLAPLAHATSSVNQTAVDNGIAYLNTQLAADGHVGGSAGETGWSAIAYAAADNDLDSVKTLGGTSLLAYLTANPPAAAAVSTDWERSILALTSEHHNPYNFGGVNYVDHLKSFASGHQIGSTGASNDDYFGLMALMAARVDPILDPVASDEIAYIIGQQHANGGFSYSTSAGIGSDVDDTAAALMALQAAENGGAGGSAIDTAISNAITYILGTKNADGGFPYDPLNPPAFGGNASNVSSTSWVVMALEALGLDSSADSTGAQAYIRGAQSADGSFPYQAPAAGDVFDTAPAVTALAGGTYPFKIYNGVLPLLQEEDDAIAPTPTPTPTVTPTPTPSPTPTASPDVLGASTGPGAGGVLPAVGELSNFVLMLIALFLALISGVIVFLRQRRRA